MNSISRVDLHLDLQQIPFVQRESLFDIFGCDQLHLVFGIIRHQWEDDGSLHLAMDEDRITSGAAIGGIFRSDLNARCCFEVFKGLERFRVDEFEVERSRIGIDEKFFDELLSYPGDLGKVTCLS